MPTLVIGARYDTMDPAHMEMMVEAFRTADTSTARTAATSRMYDDQQTYFDGLLAFIHDVDAGRF